MKNTNFHILCSLLSLLLFVKVNAQVNTKYRHFKNLTGLYKSKNGLQFFIRKDNFFYMLKVHNKAADAVVPSCDTVSKGSWSYYSESVLKLSNDTDFQNVKFNVIEENRLSKDSIYIKIALSKDDAFFVGKFNYEISVLPKIDFIDSTNPVIIIPQKKLFEVSDLYYHLALTIQDLSPFNCNLNGRCYQRIYFRIFQDYLASTKFNYFTIMLPSFNDCYVERIDVDNQLILIENDKIHWQDIEFTKVK